MEAVWPHMVMMMNNTRMVLGAHPTIWAADVVFVVPLGGAGVETTVISWTATMFVVGPTGFFRTLAEIFPPLTLTRMPVLHFLPRIDVSE
jgi:hypothetical protein